MLAWFTRNITLTIGIVVTGAILGIAIVSASEPTTEAAFIAARQVYGLTAMGILLGACLIGPLTAVLPRMPFNAVLRAGRRAIGVSAFVVAIPHVACYTWPVLQKNWRDVYEPGLLWVVGLGLGLLAFFVLFTLSWTSRDAAVQAMGGRRWKRLHRTVYFATPILFLHALLVGTDFGIATPAHGEADFGALIAFTILTFAWLMLAWLRQRGFRWPTRPPGDLPHTPSLHL